MSDAAVGARIRVARKKMGLSQKALAQDVEISASYLNMIEKGQRKVAGGLLGRLAQALGLDTSTLDGQDQAQLRGDLTQILSAISVQRPAHQTENASNSLLEFAARYPDWAAILVDLHQQNSAIQKISSRLQDQSSFDAHLAEIGHQMLQHLTTVRSSAAILRESERLSAPAKQRFGDIVERESQALETMSRDFFERLEVLGKDKGPVGARRAIDNILHANLNYFEALEELADQNQSLALTSFHETRAMVRTRFRVQIEAQVSALGGDQQDAVGNALFLYLEQYFVAALHMPYQLFSQAADESGYDVDLLAAQFGVSVEQVCHRLTTLRQAGSKSIAFALMKVDAAGNVLKAYSLPEFFVPASGATCAKWPIYLGDGSAATTRAHRIDHDQHGSFLAITRALVPSQLHFGQDACFTRLMLVCRWPDAPRTVYHQSANASAISAGTSCSICQFPNCAHRLRHSLL